MFDFSPSHQQIVPNCRGLPCMNLEGIVRAREDTVTLVMECDRSEKMNGKNPGQDYLEIIEQTSGYFLKKGGQLIKTLLQCLSQSGLYYDRKG